MIGRTFNETAMSKLLHKFGGYYNWPKNIQDKVLAEIAKISPMLVGADRQNTLNLQVRDIESISLLLGGYRSEANLFILPPAFVDGLFTHLGYATRWSPPTPNFELAAQFELCDEDPNWDAAAFDNWRYDLRHMERLEIKGACWDRYYLTIKPIGNEPQNLSSLV